MVGGGDPAPVLQAGAPHRGPDARRGIWRSLGSFASDVLAGELRSDCLEEYEIVLAVGNVIDHANRPLEKCSLRACDAVHLATAVVTNQRLIDRGLVPAFFLSSDLRLNEAASAEGLAVDNPNHHR